MSQPTVTLNIPVTLAQELLAVIDSITAHQPLNRKGMRNIVILGDSLEEGYNKTLAEFQQAQQQAQQTPPDPPKEPAKP